MLCYTARSVRTIRQSALHFVSSWLQSPASNDIDLANRELDDFFGAQNTPTGQNQQLPIDIGSPLELHARPLTVQPALADERIRFTPTHHRLEPMQASGHATHQLHVPDASTPSAAIKQSRPSATSAGVAEDTYPGMSEGTSGRFPTDMLHGGTQPDQHHASDDSFHNDRNPVASSPTNHTSDGATNHTSDGASSLTHVDATGRASMVDVGEKPSTERVAEASAKVFLGEAAFLLVQANKMKKGDVLTVAQLAGIMGSKATSSLIPLCHPLALTKADVQLSLQAEEHAVKIWASARTVGQTGVEMEALTAAAVAALTVYDMCKAVSKGIVISDLQLEFKSGGRGGMYRRQPT